MLQGDIEKTDELLLSDDPDPEPKRKKKLKSKQGKPGSPSKLGVRSEAMHFVKSFFGMLSSMPFFTINQGCTAVAYD